ncbi:hypothetical protein [Nitrosophilus kaiyonis]|uniref:hypothetical protein n=1 Tax=Nitrosophilus kaiyonis TaxID=2930200 RepID=UPI002492A34C|nr:hypothetical protein [Nitrosophilus kaiyonis]
MKIEFKKIGFEPKKFQLSKNGIEFQGEFKKDKDGLVDILGNIKNELNVTCDRCSKEFMIKLDENIHLKASDGLYKGHLEEYDVLEFYDGMIDFDEILESEIASIKLDYHICNECEKIEDFEKEF